jgi:Ca2+-transporting ATPase
MSPALGEARMDALQRHSSVHVLRETNPRNGFVANKLQAGLYDGLTQAEAAQRLVADGPNALPGNESQPMWRIATKVLMEPMFLMLLVAGITYLLLGDPGEAAFLLVAVFAVIGLTLAQERRTQRALEALRDLSAPRALVVRGGIEQRIAGRDVVVGDLLVLHEGDRVAADAQLWQGHASTDESLLTGEAAPVAHWPAPAAEPEGMPGVAGVAGAPVVVELLMAVGVPGAEASPFVFAGTVVTQGAAVARVVATGSGTAVGKIGAALAATTTADSRLQRESRRLVRVLAAVGLSLAVMLVTVAWLWDGKPFLESMLLGIGLAMAILPEEIPVAITVFLALGAWRLSVKHVLTRRVEAVEALGAITVLAVDKTGTLTSNRMQVAQLRTQGRTISALASVGAGDEMAHETADVTADATLLDPPTTAVLPDAFHDVAEFALLATPADSYDPMDKAIRAFVSIHRVGTEHGHADWSLQRTYPLSRELLAVTQVFQPGKTQQLPEPQRVIAVKGASEAVADLCHLSAAARAQIEQDVREMAAQGLRVLGVAKGNWHGGALPAEQHVFDFTFVGLVGFADPPRPEVPAAVANCRKAGVRIIMMTGDHPATAQAIAAQVGLEADAPVLTGPELAAMDDAALRQRLPGVSICARLAPDQKLRLVRALQADGETVGMTGDGVNDAPALKAADVGIAMGQRGTDVAREAAAIVLLDDSFASIAGAIAQGRRIDDNLRTAVRFLFAVHMPVIALALVPALLHWPVLLMPAQIVLLELMIDPACSIVFESEPAAADLMERRPAQASASPFSYANIGWGLLQGLGLAVVISIGCAFMVQVSTPDAQVRTAAFLTLVGSLLMLVPAQRGRAGGAKHGLRNRWLGRLLLGVGGLLTLVLAVPQLRRLVGFELPGAQTLKVMAVMVVASLLWLVVSNSCSRPARRSITN